MLKDRNRHVPTPRQEVNPTNQNFEISFIADDRKVLQSFGHQPTIFATLLLITAIILGFHDGTVLFSGEFLVAACCLVLAFLLLAYDKFRRKRRIILVSDEGNVAIYRRRKYDLTVAPGMLSVTGFWSSGLFHWGLYIAASLALLGALLIAVGATGLLKDGAVAGRSDYVIALAAGLAAWSSLASALWTSFARVHLGIPVKGSTWTEEILVSPSRLRAVFPDINIRKPKRPTSVNR
jgi:hypothetical protein